MERSLSLEEDEDVDEEWWRDEDELLLLDLEDDLDEEDDLDDEDDFDEDDDLEDDLDDDLEEDEEEDLSEGTSRMLSSRPVVGSVVEAMLGLWAT
ncbi:hypothetical protein ACQRIU_005345 [Beauveria bassiana]